MTRTGCRVCAATFGRASSIVIRVLVRPHNRCRWFGTILNNTEITVPSTLRESLSIPRSRMVPDAPVSCLTVKPWALWGPWSMGLGAGNDPVSNVSATIARVRGPAHAPPPALRRAGADFNDFNDLVVTNCQFV